MQAPTIRVINGVPYCGATRSALLEYELWCAGPSRLKDIVSRVNTKYGKSIKDVHGQALLVRLVATGRVERIARGVYFHKDSPFA